MLVFIAIWLGRLLYCCAYQKSQLAGQNEQGFSRGLCCAEYLKIQLSGWTVFIDSEFFSS